MAKAKRKPNGDSGRYIVVTDCPLKFRTPQFDEEYGRLLHEQKTGELAAKFPNKKYPNEVGHAIDERMLKRITHEFNEHNEFPTKDKELAIAAFRAAKRSNPRAALRYDSLPIPESELLEPGHSSDDDDE